MSHPKNTPPPSGIEFLRPGSPEVLAIGRKAIIAHGVANIRPHVAIEAAPATNVVSMDQYRQRSPAEAFDEQVTANLQPAAGQLHMSKENLATITDLGEYRARQAVEAAQQGLGNSPLLEEYLSNV